MSFDSSKDGSVQYKPPERISLKQSRLLVTDKSNHQPVPSNAFPRELLPLPQVVHVVESYRLDEILKDQQLVRLEFSRETNRYFVTIRVKDQKYPRSSVVVQDTFHVAFNPTRISGRVCNSNNEQVSSLLLPQVKHQGSKTTLEWKFQDLRSNHSLELQYEFDYLIPHIIQEQDLFFLLLASQLSFRGERKLTLPSTSSDVSNIFTLLPNTFALVRIDDIASLITAYQDLGLFQLIQWSEKTLSQLVNGSLQFDLETTLSAWEYSGFHMPWHFSFSKTIVQKSSTQFYLCYQIDDVPRYEGYVLTDHLPSHAKILSTVPSQSYWDWNDDVGSVESGPKVFQLTFTKNNPSVTLLVEVSDFFPLFGPMVLQDVGGHGVLAGSEAYEQVWQGYVDTDQIGSNLDLATTYRLTRHVLNFNELGKDVSEELMVDPSKTYNGLMRQGLAPNLSEGGANYITDLSKTNHSLLSVELVESTSFDKVVVESYVPYRPSVFVKQLQLDGGEILPGDDLTPPISLLVRVQKGERTNLILRNEKGEVSANIGIIMKKKYQKRAFKLPLRGNGRWGLEVTTSQSGLDERLRIVSGPEEE